MEAQVSGVVIKNLLQKLFLLPGDRFSARSPTGIEEEVIHSNQIEISVPDKTLHTSRLDQKFGK